MIKLKIKNLGFIYVGSTINIAGRMKNYLNVAHLKLNHNYNMPISKAFYNYDNIALVIVEYILELDLHERENY